MPSYAKFMKSILSRMVKPDDLDTVALTEECSPLLQQKLPPKLKDPATAASTLPGSGGTFPFRLRIGSLVLFILSI
ncbi:hypothetical protein AgCh_028716 [Apium graveolens]